MKTASKRQRKAIEEHRGFKIRRRGEAWMVDARRAGIAKRKTFPDLDRAKVYCDQLAVELQSNGAKALSMPDKLRLDAQDAAAVLNGRATLLEAATYWTKHHPETGTVTLADLAGRFLDNLRRQNCRETTITERRQKVNRLCRDMGAQSVFDMTAAKLSTWLDVQGFKPVTRNNHRRCYAALFNFALKQGLMDANPAAVLPATRGDEKLPEYWPPKTVEKVMRAAENNSPEIVPALAVSFFAGLRPGEVSGLRWEAVNLAERFIRVMPETSKRRRSRIVPIGDTLARWLGKQHKPEGALALKPGAFRRARKVVMKKAGVTRWPPDITRHCFATYRFAETQDAARVAAELGHSGAIDVLVNHYRGLATPAEAKAFWKIAPAGRPNVIALGA